MKQLIWVMVIWVGFHFMVPVLRAGTRLTPGQDVDLVKIQKQEEERRKKAPKPKYSFTDEDLKKVNSAAGKANITEMTGKKDESAEKKEKKTENQEKTSQKETSGESGEAVTAESENQDTQSEEGQKNLLKAAMKTENYWKEEKTRIQTEINSLETTIKQQEDKLVQLKTRLNVQGIDMLTEQLRVEREVNKLTNVINEQKAKLEGYKKELEDLYEKARQEGIPPGWLRD